MGRFEDYLKTQDQKKPTMGIWQKALLAILAILFYASLGVLAGGMIYWVWGGGPQWTATGLVLFFSSGLVFYWFYQAWKL
jgi:hypothetical protein